ncbi:MAG: YciI family protein [bacterium]
MALFILQVMDKPDLAPLRAQIRPDHLAFLQAAGAAVKLAGPLLDHNGVPIGSLLLLEMASQKEAEQFAASDPYAKAGLFASVTVTPYRIVINSLSK